MCINSVTSCILRLVFLEAIRRPLLNLIFPVDLCNAQLEASCIQRVPKNIIKSSDHLVCLTLHYLYARFLNSCKHVEKLQDHPSLLAVLSKGYQQLCLHKQLLELIDISLTCAGHFRGTMRIEEFIAGFIIFHIIEKVKAHVEIEAEDYFFPLEPLINFCKLADQCEHDFVPLCGQDSVGVTRMFKDNCDMFEYNCDEKKQFRHVKLNVCEFQKESARILLDDDPNSHISPPDRRRGRGRRQN